MFGNAFSRKLLLGTMVSGLCACACSAQAAVEISSKATQNVSCSGGVCAPTAANAILNANDLETMLESGNATVTTTGSGNTQADDIVVEAPVSWAASGTLALDAYRSIAVEAAVSVNGLSGMSLTTNDGGQNGTLWFSSKGHIAFKNLSSQLSINAASYTLAGSISTLARAIEENPGGDFALAADYNAKRDGTYSASPINAIGGIVTGLGNTISNLSINDKATSDAVGLFHQLYAGSTVENLNLSSASVNGPAGTSTDYSAVGALAGFGGGLMFNDSASGHVSTGSNEYTSVGGLVGSTGPYEQYVANVIDCSSSVTASAGASSSVGGLVGSLIGTMSQSYATGPVSLNSQGTVGGSVGGLVGVNNTYDGSSGSISNSYASGDMSADYSSIGGLVGYNNSGATIGYAYSTGQASGSNSTVGGLLGWDDSQIGNLKHNYWDTTTSGITNPAQGAGNIANDPGITGLTNKQLTAKLPKGFGKSVWHETAKLNGGMPYLLANPPAK